MAASVSRPPVGWDPEEAKQLLSLICEIESFEGPRRRPPVNSEIELKLSDAVHLLPNLAATTRGLLVRQILLTLGFDERRLGEWRLEHKLVQALVIHHYSPGSIPLTRGLDRIIRLAGREPLRELLPKQFQSGFVVKTTLGDSSGEDDGYRTDAALSCIENGGRLTPEPGPLTAEEFIVQERVRIRCEYRVHTVEDDVIDDLTVRRHHGAVAPGERTGPNRFVRSVLEALPAGIMAGALLAWDIAQAEDGSFSVIEMNVGGIHTVYNPGFHSSGYYHHKDYGCVYTARLIRFIERTYGCQLHVVADSPDYPFENWFYHEVEDWKLRF